MTSQLLGKSLVGFQDASGAAGSFRAISPQTNTPLEPSFVSATPEEVERAAQLAHDAFSPYGQLSGKEKSAFLRSIASNIESISDSLIARTHLETSLPVPRLQGELARTCGQLRLFASVVEDGSWTSPRIDRADPDRKPARKPDIRSVLRPVGPVVVFGASNFPLAFSVAGGDTASALAAGNPVIVKAHLAHPGASELVGRAILKAAERTKMPDGVFSLLHGASHHLSERLGPHPPTKARGV